MVAREIAATSFREFKVAIILPSRGFIRGSYGRVNVYNGVRCEGGKGPRLNATCRPSSHRSGGTLEKSGKSAKTNRNFRPDLSDA